MAEEFLSLLKEWEKLCNNMVLSVPPPPPNEVTHLDDNTDDDSPLEPGEFEVENLLEICYVKKKGLYFKVLSLTHPLHKLIAILISFFWLQENL